MIKAYAKINLGLLVTGVQGDYHTIEAINCKINLYDSIKITKSFKTKIVYDKFQIKKEEDTIYKMVMDLKYIYPNIPNLLIRIKKRIPVAAGLGGMSSDAAGILAYLNKKYDLGLGLSQMKRFLLQYGTDMCYSLYNSTCLVKGIGEQITPIDLDLPKKVIVLYPFIKIATKDIYAKVEKFSKPLYSEALSNYRFKKLATFLRNDLEDVVLKTNDEMKEIINVLRENIKEPVVMSGSGSTIIIYSSNKKILRSIRKIYPEYLVGMIKIINKETKTK